MKTDLRWSSNRLVAASVLFALILALAFPSQAQLPNAWQISDNSIGSGSLLFYTTNLTSPQQVAATNAGFRLTVTARMPQDFGSIASSITMIYGSGTFRYGLFFDLSAGGALVASLLGSSNVTVVSDPVLATNYHTHELALDPGTQLLTYKVDGAPVVSWPGETNSAQTGMVYWGAGSSSGRGEMNFHQVKFEITGQGIVAQYDAGVAGNPPVAPSPTNQAWVRNIGATAIPEGPLSPDLVELFPAVTTLPATNIGPTAATLNGKIDPNGIATAYYWEFGETTNYGAFSATNFLPVGILSNTNVSVAVSGLEQNTTYHARLSVDCFLGTFSGTDQSFATLPFVATLVPTELTPDSATLNAALNPGGLAADYYWEYGTTTNFGASTATNSIAAGINSATNVSAPITGLTIGTVYYCRAVLSNAAGIFEGDAIDFVAPVFTNLVITGLREVFEGCVTWADYDRDGRMDFLSTGTTNTLTFSLDGQVFSQLWRNTGNGFTNVNIPNLRPGMYSSVGWADYDNDGRPDFLFAGQSNGSATATFTHLWRNTGSGFTNVPLLGLLPPSSGASVAWADFDGDGRADFLISGGGYSQLWRNTGGSFTNVPIPGLPGLIDASAAWGDFDNDGRPDFLITGYNPTAFPHETNTIWRNTGTGFTNVTASVAPGLPQVSFSSVAWSDFDNDGRLDFLIAGYNSGADQSYCQLWRNTGSGFTNVPIPGLPGVIVATVAWADFDNDGLQDFILTGSTNSLVVGPVSQLWRNTGTGFTNVPTGLPGVWHSSVAWADFDNDGRPDLALSGLSTTGSVTRIYRNLWPGNSNSPPSTPANLSVTPVGTQVTFNWSEAGDTETPSTALTYNLRLGTTPGGGEIVSPLSSTAGFRYLPAPGNRERQRSMSLKLELLQTYYWSVQAVDNGYLGGPFAAERSFTLASVFAPTNGVPVLGDQNGDGIVDQSEFTATLQNYLQTSPPNIESVSLPGQTSFQFGLTNLDSLSFHVLATTNVALPLVDWENLGAATLQYEFTDPNATNYSQRFYQLIWP